LSLGSSAAAASLDLKLPRLLLLTVPLLLALLLAAASLCCSATPFRRSCWSVAVIDLVSPSRPLHNNPRFLLSSLLLLLLNPRLVVV
jgi:hypothetical protein